MKSDQKIYHYLEKLTNLLDKILVQKDETLKVEEKIKLQKVYQLIDHSLLNELKACEFLKLIDVSELK